MKRIPVPPEISPLLGTVPDISIAGLAGVSPPTVRRWRIEAGIAAYASDGLVATASYRCTPEATRAHLDTLAVRYGCVSWQLLADRCRITRQRMHEALRDGVTPSTLRRWTRAARLPSTIVRLPPHATSEQPRGGVPRRDCPPDLAHLVGVISNRALSKRASVSERIVARWVKEKESGSLVSGLDA